MKHSKSIWIVEDDPGSQFVYNEILGFRYRLQMLNSIQMFRNAWKNQALRKPDLMIIDLHLPDESFITFLQTDAGKEMTRSTPFIVVSSLDDLDAMRICYEEGAVEFISKPFAKSELIVKVERTLAAPKDVKRNTGKAIQLDPISFTLVKDGRRSEELTAKEYKILAIILGSKDHKVNRQDLQELVWGDQAISGKSLDQHFFHLRRKISPLGLEIMYATPVYRLV